MPRHAHTHPLQAITGKRWLHHTSLLWDFDPSNMRLLKHPAKAPVYREAGVRPAMMA